VSSQCYQTVRDENGQRSAILNRMTQTKRPVIDANPKAVESWDNEGGAPASGDRSWEFATAEPSGYGQIKADIEVRKVEEHPSGRLLYIICMQAPDGRMEFPIAVPDEGIAAQNEAAALRSALRLAENLAESLRRRLGLGNN
jgi:hypothetical protein